MDPLIDHYSKKNFTHITYETSQRFIFRFPRFRKSKMIVLNMLFYYLKSLLFIKTIKCPAKFLDAYTAYTSVMTESGLQKHIESLKVLKLEASYLYQLSKYFICELNKVNQKVHIIDSFNDIEL